MEIDQRQIERIDRYLADEAKILSEPQPGWVHQKGYGDYQLTWPIEEEVTGFTRSKLKFRIPEDRYHYPSISLIFRTEIVARLDRVTRDECKPNPPAAAQLGLPAQICGTHVHSWSDNRSLVLRSGVWDLPIRRPVTDKLREIEDMFFWFCHHINVRIQGHARRLDVPSETLFGGADG